MIYQNRKMNSIEAVEHAREIAKLMQRQERDKPATPPKKVK